MEQIRDRIKELRRVKASDLLAHPGNWRTHPKGQAAALSAVLQEVGYADALLARETPQGLQLIDGHLRQKLTPDQDVPVLVLDVTEDEANKILLTLDPLAAMAEADKQALDALLHDVTTGDAALQEMLSGLAKESGLTYGAQEGGNGPIEPEIAHKTLAERFLIPPFSVLDARQGYWQDRKRAWLALGIESELGRGGADKLTMSATVQRLKPSADQALKRSRNGGGASPGGSPRPACDYSKRERGDGYGRAIKRANVG